MADEGVKSDIISGMVREAGVPDLIVSEYSDELILGIADHDYHSVPLPICGEFDSSSHVDTSSESEGVKSTDYGQNFLFERVWVVPQEFNIPFIVEDIERELKIWNAYRTTIIQVTAISVYQQTGTDLTYPSLPDTIAQFGETIYTLEVYADGPPIQDTIYSLTINSISFEIPVTGIRIIPFDLDANWDQEIVISYEFQSIIYRTPLLKEQRRSLAKQSWMSIDVVCDINSRKSRKVLNLLSYGHDKVIGVPIYSEKLKPTALTLDSTTINLEETTTYYYNLQRSSYIIIIDHQNGISEVKEIDQLNANSIDLNQGIGQTFDVNYSYVYPCAFCLLISISDPHLTDDFDELRLEFKEYKSG